jgi:hypothetical protein
VSKGGDDNKARAKELADSIRDRNQPPSIDAMNRIYDVVLNMNSLNSKPGDGISHSTHNFLYRRAVPPQGGEVEIEEGPG